MTLSVDEMIEALGNTGAVASELGVAASTVSSWRARNSIPSERWTGLAAMARARSVEGITIEALAALHSKHSEPTAEART